MKLPILIACAVILFNQAASAVHESSENPYSYSNLEQAEGPKKFDKSDWKKMLDFYESHRADFSVGLDRSKLFCLFLKEYNLIGMTKSKVVDLLGKGERRIRRESGKNIVPGQTVEEYVLTAGWEGSSYSGFQIQYRRGVVWRWCLTAYCIAGSGPWIAYHAILVPNKESGLAWTPVKK